MKSFIVISIIFSIAIASPIDEVKSGLRPRIVGGNIATPHSLPYQVGLLFAIVNGESWCGGTLITNQTILTAAHCVDSALGAVAYLGAHNVFFDAEPGQQKISIEQNQIIMHEKYDPNSNLNDVALIKLPQPIELNEYIQLAKLPRKSQLNTTFTGKRVIASGWGFTSDAPVHMLAPLLHYVDMNVLSNTECNAYFQGTIPESNICLDGKLGQSACRGDSGGPIIYEEQDGRKTVIGVASFVSGLGCESGYPSVYTRVTSQLDWISKHAGIPIEN